ncbi:MAG: hypothetical protein FWG16_03350, partial [Micrococcales bacterium]|nr:hypothetical protein [Micrococcales bacterium]
QQHISMPNAAVGHRFLLSDLSDPSRMVLIPRWMVLDGVAGRANLTLRVCAGPTPAELDGLVRRWMVLVGVAGRANLKPPGGLRLANPSEGGWVGSGVDGLSSGFG